PSETTDWGRDAQGRIDLQTVVNQVKPTVLIGTSTVAGAFSQTVVQDMARHCARPLILPLSNPTHLAEATPADLLTWTHGRALVASGSPFAPVSGSWGVRTIGQCNNCFVFPGLGFAAVAVGLSQITDAMIDAGLAALAAEIPASDDPDAALMPPLTRAAVVARCVAEAVALCGVRQGLARRAQSPEQALQCLAEARWQPVYGSLLPSNQAGSAV
ncbi:MAG: malic enzyme-like NAD(P)-binding protein, partial [Cyanobacteriota bacterium]|nr:malic enzyme-like NAD(P)-binding protein [Cyanobacteriota bacterium]